MSRRRNGNAFTYFKVKAGDFDLFQVESHVYASKSVGQSLDKMVTTLLIFYSFTNAKTCHVTTTNKFNFTNTLYSDSNIVIHRDVRVGQIKARAHARCQKSIKIGLEAQLRLDVI